MGMVWYNVNDLKMWLLCIIGLHSMPSNILQRPLNYCDYLLTLHTTNKIYLKITHHCIYFCVKNVPNK